MSYSGADASREARTRLGAALGALQQHDDIPDDIMAVASNVAQAVGALFEAQNAPSEAVGQAAVKSALGTLSQTLALLQDVPDKFRAQVDPTVEAIATSMSQLYPLANAPAPAARPAGFSAPVPAQEEPIPLSRPEPAAARSQPAPVIRSAPDVPRAPASSGERRAVEANIGATTDSNFYVGFSGEISEGGVFLATYDVQPIGTAIDLTVTLPGGFEFQVPGWVRFIREPHDFASNPDPGMGIQFQGLNPDARELILRFIRKRAPTFYDD